MKKINKYIIGLFSLLLLVASCTTDRGGIDPRAEKEIVKVPAIVTKVDPSGSQSIDVTNLGSFEGKIIIDEYFDEGPRPEKVDLVVRKNGVGGDAVKIVQAGITSFPTSVSISGAKIVELFGTEPALGDNYDFSADIYIGGQKFEAFPAIGNGTSGGPIGMPGYSEFARFGAICAYSPDLYQGDFEVVYDDWDFFEPGDIVPITKINDTQFSFNYAPDDGGNEIIVTVNPGNNSVSVHKQVYADSDLWGWGYGPISVETAPSPVNEVAPCDETFGLTLKHTVGAGSFGDFSIVFKKVN